MLDAVSSPNLAEYLFRHRKTMSLRTKLFFLAQIAHGLRFLRNYNIAHLDIKANNVIIILKDFLTKIIDFGESFHPEVNKKNFHPGFTLPYCAPEVFDLVHNGFNYQQDVFSFGILMYEVIFENNLLTVN